MQFRKVQPNNDLDQPPNAPLLARNSGQLLGVVIMEGSGLGERVAARGEEIEMAGIGNHDLRRTAFQQLGKLLECDLGKASELARMQALPVLRFELFQHFQTDLKMLTYALAVEFAGHTSELDFTVKWLIRHAE